MNRTILRSVSVAVAGFVLAATALAQTDHVHALHVNGVPGGLPVFCAAPTAVAVSDGAWSSAGTWSTGRVPGAADKVAIPAGRAVSYDVVSDAVLPCVEVKGRLAFDPTVNTRMKVVNLTVMDEGVARSRDDGAADWRRRQGRDRHRRRAIRLRRSTRDRSATASRRSAASPCTARPKRRPSSGWARKPWPASRRWCWRRRRPAGRRATESSFPIPGNCATASAAAGSSRRTRRSKSPRSRDRGSR